MLSGKDKEGNPTPYHLGHFFIAIDTEAFMGLEIFKKISGNILRDLRNSQKAPGEDRIFTAGEKEYEIWLERKEKGLPLTEASKKDLMEVNDRLKLNIEFPF